MQEMEKEIKDKLDKLALEKVEHEVKYMCGLLEAVDYWDLSAEFYQKWQKSEAKRKLRELENQSW